MRKNRQIARAEGFKIYVDSWPSRGWSIIFHFLSESAHSTFVPKRVAWKGRGKEQVYSGETRQTLPQPGYRGPC